MGLLNVLKAKWDGKVGQTVGAKWKNKATIRTYSIPSNPKTEAQQKVRGVFGQMTTFVAMFADQIRYKSALDTSGMSVRNAIIALNKEQITAGAFDEATLLISKGGLQKPASFTATASAGVLSLTWDAPVASNFTSEAKLIVVAVQPVSGLVEVLEAEASAESATGTLTFTTGQEIHAYAYFLDKRGSTKVGSESVYATHTPA